MFTFQDDGYEQEALLALLCINGGGVQISHTEINEMGVTMQQAIKKVGVLHFNSICVLQNIYNLTLLNDKRGRERIVCLQKAGYWMFHVLFYSDFLYEMGKFQICMNKVSQRWCTLRL